MRNGSGENPEMCIRDRAQVTELEKNARLLDEHLARLASRETVLKEKKAFIGQWIEVGANLNEVRSLRRIKTAVSYTHLYTPLITGTEVYL